MCFLPCAGFHYYANDNLVWVSMPLRGLDSLDHELFAFNVEHSILDVLSHCVVEIPLAQQRLQEVSATFIASNQFPLRFPIVNSNTVIRSKLNWLLHGILEQLVDTPYTLEIPTRKNFQIDSQTFS